MVIRLNLSPSCAAARRPIRRVWISLIAYRSIHHEDRFHGSQTHLWLPVKVI